MEGVLFSVCTVYIFNYIRSEARVLASRKQTDLGVAVLAKQISFLLEQNFILFNLD
jgi:hypothetical protein